MEAARETVVSSFPPVLIVCLSQYFTPLPFPSISTPFSRFFFSIFDPSSFLYLPLCVFTSHSFSVADGEEQGKRQEKIQNRSKGEMNTQ